MNPAEGEWTRWLYEAAWELTGLPRESPPTSAGAGDAALWLILTDEGEVGANLAWRLEMQGHTCLSLRAGSQAAAGDVIRDLAARGQGTFAGVVHLWGLDAGDSAPMEAPERGCESVLSVLQALVASGGTPRLWIATRGTQPAGDGNASSVASAALWGLGRVIALEHPEIWGGLIDLDPIPRDSDAACLIRELAATDEDQVAWRDGRRYVLRLRRYAHSAAAAARPLDSEALYLITGGLGSLGLRVARYLVERGARHLVLVGRRGLRARAAEAVGALEEVGANVRAAAVDVSDLEGLGHLFDDLRRSGRPLRGIVHAAGVSVRQDLETLTPAALRDVLAAKVAGGWNLHQLSREEDLEFFVCFASVSGVLGSRNLGAYAAANSFLDTLAHHRRSRGLPGLSIDWGPWAEGGMVSGEEGEQLVRMGMHPLASSPALDALGGLWSGDSTQVVVADVDWPRFAAVLETRRPRPLLRQVAPTANPVAAGVAPCRESAFAHEFASASGPEREALLIHWLQEQTANVLALPAGIVVDPRRGFFEMGIDSLMALELKQRLEAVVGRQLPGTLVLEFPNIQSLARALSTEESEPSAGPVPRAVSAPAVVGPAQPASLQDLETELLRELEALHY